MDERPRFGHRVEYFFARGLLAFLSRLPAFAGKRLGRSLGRAVGRVLSGRSRLAAANMRAAFPDSSEDQIQRWVKECWENLGQAAWEFSRVPRMTKDDYFKMVQLEGIEHLQKSFALGKGVVLFTSHTANWELTTQFLPFLGYPLAVIARRMKNPLVNDLITNLRAAKGIRVFMHKQAVRESLRWLKEGKTLGLLIDQRITDGGVRVPFFGRPAHTTTMPALLALRVGAQVHAVQCRREGDRLRLIVEPAMDLSDCPPGEEGLAKATARMTAVVERWTREQPPLWLWIHDRWKL